MGVFGTPSEPRAGRSADPDGDGLPNGHEFVAGSDPLDAASGLKIPSVILTPSAGVTIIWQSVPGKLYTVQNSTDMRAWEPSGAPIRVNSTTGTYTEPQMEGARPVSCRIRVQD